MAILILLAFFILAWVVLVLPRQRELKRHQKLIAELDVGEDVMMTSGIYGVIRSIDGEYVQLEIADGLEIRIAKRSIAARVTDAEPGDLEPESAEAELGGTALPASDSDDSDAVGQTPVIDEPGPDRIDSTREDER